MYATRRYRSWYLIPPFEVNRLESIDTTVLTSQAILSGCSSLSARGGRFRSDVEFLAGRYRFRF
jgi:hypothetical protein